MNTLAILTHVMTPKILLIGYGKFGKAHFEVLQTLHHEKHIMLAGVVTKKQKLNLPGNFPTYITIFPALLKSVDAVIIVTPITTHYTLVKKCLPHTNVFVEKPLAMTTLEGRKLIEIAKRYKKILAVGHIFRFNYAVFKLKQLLQTEKNSPYYIEGKFTGGAAEPAKDCGVVTSDMHLIDVLDDVLQKNPLSIFCQGKTNIKGYTYEDQAFITLDYPNNIHACLQLGWIKEEKIRSLNFYFSNKEIHVDLLKQDIVIKEHGKKEKILHCYKKQPLRMELEGFIEAIKVGKGKYISGDVANRIVGIVEKCRKSMKQTIPKIAVIGGGVYGVSIARELASFANVTLFERNDDIFSEASLVNQNRHHYGYHYHQSSETAEECIRAKKDFENIWGGAILSNFPSFWCVAKTASTITPDTFQNFCKKYNLFYKEEWPSEELLNRDEISACFKTYEPVYEPSAFKALAKKELQKHDVGVRVQHEVKGGKIVNGKKVMTMQHGDTLYTESFDHVINATYTNINVFCMWFGFPRLKIDFRLKELLYIRIPKLAPLGITVMDKYVSVLPVDGKGLFSLGDVVRSFHEKKISSKGVPWTKKDFSHIPSHQKDLLEGNIHFMPILKNAKLEDAKWTVLPVKTWLANDDNRTPEVVSHGQGCWSVLGGKIITSVTTAKKIAKAIRDAQD